MKNRLLWANPYFASQNNLFRHGYRRATFPRGEGFAAAPLNYNLQHIEEDSQELEGTAEDYEDVEY